MSPADSIYNRLRVILPGYRFQFGAWTDGAPGDRFAVVRPDGGPRPDGVRRPRYSVILIGAIDQAATETAQDAEFVALDLRTNQSGAVALLPSEPVFFSTAERRPVFEITVESIINAEE